MICWSDFPSDS